MKLLELRLKYTKNLVLACLEQVYETCLAIEFEKRGLQFHRQQKVAINYKGKNVNTSLRYDFLVEDCIVVELKAVVELNPIFNAQTITYARLLEKPKATFINFTCDNIFKNGQKTFVTDYFRLLPEE